MKRYPLDKAIFILSAVCSVSLCAIGVSAEPASDSFYEKAAQMIEAGEYDGAEKALKESLAKNKKDYRAMEQLGIVYQEKGDRGRALKFFKSSIQTNPDQPRAYFLLGRLYFLMQKEESAISEFNTFMDKLSSPSINIEATKEACIKMLHSISEICSNLKRYDEVKRAINKVIELDPKDQSAYYNLGVYYYNAEHDRAKAYQNFKKSVDLNPNTLMAKKSKYSIEFIRTNPDSRIAPDLSFVDQEYKE